ncbi:hypothetical protein [Bifidobacterium simiarum]|nr:hypothetical protein [Bifidobacterium simiarum]
MDMQNIEVGNLTVSIPVEYARLNRMPDDPPQMVAYATQTEQADCVMFLQPIPAEHAMPFNDERAVINGIHQSLADDQGLIEVVSGTTDAKRNVIWSIVKTVSRTEGAQYGLTLHLAYPESVLQVQAFANETGITGMRDAQIYELARKRGRVDEQGRGWTRDPYDDDYRRGILMNLSEDDQFDDAFPDHPLSVIRRLAGMLIGYN